MTDDDLRAALAAADPVRSVDLDPLTSPRARELLERTMSTPPRSTTPTTPTAPTTDRTSDGGLDAGAHPAARPTPLPRRPWLAAAAAAVVLAGGGAAYLAADGSSDDAPAGGELALALPGGDPAAMSCLRPSAEVLQTQPVAFAGTATAVTDAEVRLAVDRWYSGGDATTVVLRNQPEVMQALLGATDFQEGGDYLVSADQGTVSVCGLTGEASPELQAIYDQAFPGS